MNEPDTMVSLSYMTDDLIASARRKLHLSLIFLEFLSEMDLEVLGLASKISAERAVFASSERGIFEGVPDANRL